MSRLDLVQNPPVQKCLRKCLAVVPSSPSRFWPANQQSPACLPACLPACPPACRYQLPLLSPFPPAQRFSTHCHPHKLQRKSYLSYRPLGTTRLPVQTSIGRKFYVQSATCVHRCHRRPFDPPVRSAQSFSTNGEFHVFLYLGLVGSASGGPAPSSFAGTLALGYI